MAKFEIKIQELDSGGKQYDFPLEADWLDAQFADLPEGTGALRTDSSIGAGELSLWAEMSGDDVVVRGHVRTQLVAECSRCLGDAVIPVNSELTSLFTARGGAHREVADSDELTPEELELEFFTGDTISLDEILREQLLLEVPMAPLCRPDCPGIPVPESVRGPADLSGAPVHEGQKIDPRLAPLLSLMKGKDSGEGPSDPTPPESPSPKKTSSKKTKGSN